MTALVNRWHKWPIALRFVFAVLLRSCVFLFISRDFSLRFRERKKRAVRHARSAGLLLQLSHSCGLVECYSQEVGDQTQQLYHFSLHCTHLLHTRFALIYVLKLRGATLHLRLSTTAAALDA